MQTKTLFLSLVLALAFASVASEHELEDRSPQNDNFGNVPPTAQTVDRVVQRRFSAQQLLDIPRLATQLGKRDDSSESDNICLTTFDASCEGFWTEYNACRAEEHCIDSLFNRCPVLVGACPLILNDAAKEDNQEEETQKVARQDGTGARSPIDLNPPAGKLELRYDDKHRVVRQAASKISDVIQTAMPDNVKNALIDDPGAAESLDNEFSGTIMPEWYANLPASVTEYYLTITSPPTMTGIQAGTTSQDPEQNEVENWISSVHSYEDKIAAELSAMSSMAASESAEAKQLSKLAATNSKEASKKKIDSLKTTALSQSTEAATMSFDASTLSAYAASASRAVFQDNGASKSDMQVAFVSSIFCAVVCLGLAVAL